MTNETREQWATRIVNTWPADDSDQYWKVGSLGFGLSIDRENRHIALVWGENLKVQNILGLRASFNGIGWGFSDDRQLTSEVDDIFLKEVIEEIPEDCLWSDGKGHLYALDKEKKIMQLIDGELDACHAHTKEVCERIGWKMD